MSKSRSNQNVDSPDLQAILKKKARRQKAVERAMESLESRMMLSVSGFQPAVTYNTGVGPSAVAKADFNGDGKTDLVVANQTGNNVSILSGNGNGTFGAPTNYAAGNGPRAVVTGDFNGDGKIDIAVADAAGNNISVLINNGGGGFNSAVVYNVGTDPLAIIAGDFTGHGKTDLAVANYKDNTITVLAGNGDGTFGGAQTFSVSPAANVGTGPNAIIGGDFNGDHKIDLAVSDAGGGVSILLSNGIGGFGAAHVFAAGITPTGLVTGLFNGDTNLDLAVVNATGDNVSVLLGAGDGSFGTPTNYAVGFGPQSITAADFNNDSKMDLAVVNTDSGSVSILSGRGDGSFSAATNKSVGTSPQAVVAGDFNGDGSSDLAVVNHTDDTVSVLLDKHISVVGIAQDIHEGEALANVPVATFTDSEAGTVVGDYTASINWGDGTSASAGTITFGGGHYSVAATHAYAEEGVFTITVTVQDTLGTTAQATAIGKVRDAALTSAAAVIAVNEGATFNNTVATFNDANTAAPLGDFTAVIQWGDGTSSNGTIVSDGGGAFHVNASHVWHHKSVPNVTVVISDVGSSKTTSTYTATIADAPLTPTAGTPVFTEGSSSAQTIATFTDANPYGGVSEFSATIHWGDGSSDTAATVSANGSGGYDVIGAHSYVHSGNKSASVSITSVDGQTASQNVTAAVQNAAMTATASNGQYVEAVPFSNAPVAHFTDANSGATVGDFTATIDWGDGTALDHNTTIVVDSGNPGFFVKGDHNYLHGSHPTVTVTILGAGGTTLIRSSTSQVLNQSLSAYGPFQPVVNKTTPGELYRGVSGAFNTNTNNNLGIVSASGAGGVTYMAGNGDGTFQAAVNYFIGNGVIAVAAGQFNAGNALDLVTANTGGGISIALGNGDGTFASPTNLSLSGNVHDVVVGDFNHDGNLDIATANYTAGTVSILMGAGDGTFASAVNYNVGSNPYALTVADLNGDGKMDLAVVNYSDGTVSVLLNNGDGTFASAVTYTVGTHPVAVKAGNLAGDGKIGLVVSNNGDNTVSVLKGNGDGTFVSAVTYATGLGTQDLALVDLYGTGKPDILTAAEGDGAVSILINKGDGTYAPQMKMPANHSTLGLVTGDFNADGRTDLVANSFNVNLASVFISNATPIAAVEGTAFSSNTVLMHFTDPNGSAVAADFPTVSIDWGDGHTTSGTVVANVNGGFDVVAGHSYDHAGKKTIITTVTGAGEGVVIGATKVSIANAALSLTANTIAPTEGSSFSGKVAHFTDANTAASAGDFTASIVWGDGHTTSGTVVAANGGGFDVNGVHTYDEEGAPTITTTITGLGGGTASDHATATVADAALHSTGADITGVEATALAGVTVASFTDDDPAGTSTDYTAMIHWGDNTTSAGTIAANGSGGFNVNGTHTYLHAGDHAVSVNIADTGGATTATLSNATVNNAAVTASAGAFTSIETQSHSEVIATFTDVNTSAVHGDFTATIDWGDGSTADHSGVIAATGNPGEFSLTGTHTYARNGSKPIAITIIGAYGTVATTTLNASVAIDPTVTADAIAPTEGASFSGTVAHFTDASNTATASDFTATIAWGDGSTNTGTITAANGGGFNVAGTHTYTEEGSQNFTVTITNSHGTGGTANASSTATIADAALHSAGVAITATEGTALTGVTVASFTDDDPAGTSTDYTATIHWGDNTTSAGTIAANGNGGFDVTGTHTYLHAGDHAVSVNIADTGGSTTSTLSNATVNNDTVTASAGSFTSTEGSSTSQTIATFTDANTSASPGDFGVTVTWGDGSTSSTATNAVVISGSNGNYSISGTHQYDHAGTAPISVAINGAYNQVASTSLTATIHNAVLSHVDATFTATEGISFSGVIGHFSDANAAAVAADFSASINWGDGTTTNTVPADITSDGSGGFYVHGTHTYAEEGAASVATTITGSGGGTTVSTYTSTVADAALTATSSNITAIEGTGFTGRLVANFADADPNGVIGDYTAGINWGDGHSTVGTVTADGHGGWNVSGDYLYVVAGNYVVTMTVNDIGGATQQATSVSAVAHGTISASGVNVTAVEGTALPGTTLVAHFTDTNLSAVAGNFTATIDWGDGSSPSSSTITANGGGFDVKGGHTYNHAGTNAILVSISGVGDTKTAGATATVNNNTITISGKLNNAVEGTAFIGNVVSFTDANGAAVKADFTAMIDWNDGTAPTTGTINDKSGGGFNIAGTHTYTIPASYAPTVTLTGNTGQTFTGAGVLGVADATLNPASVTIHATEGASFSGTVGTFQDQNHGSVTGDFGASINWGDGQTDTGTITSTGNGAFTISGGHTWASEGNRTVVVAVNDNGGVSASISSTAIVGDAILTATGQPVAAIEGTPLTGTLVTTFGDADPLAVATDFNATITWGDNTATSAGTITKNVNTGLFEVTGDHTYTHAGGKTASVVINDIGGATTGTSSAVTIANAALASTGNTLNATEGTALGSIVIAHFTDANPSAIAGDFSATINWNAAANLLSTPQPSVGVAIGSNNSPTIVANPNGGFDVMADHTFNHAGDQTYSVTIRGGGGGVTTPTGTVHVANAAITPSADAFIVTEGVAFGEQVVGHFTDANPNASAADFNATVFWGDSSEADTNTTIVANDNGGFDVLAGHTYAHAGDKTLGIQITGAGGTTVSTPNTAHVNNGVLIPTGYPVTAIEGAAYTGIVARFTDANAAATAADFTAVINWGDGTTGAGTIAANDNGGFDVTGTHTYNPQGTRTITTTITGHGSGQAVAHSSMVVQDALLTATGNTLAGTVNVNLNSVVIASFVDANPLDDPSHFSAIITWETGSTSAGTIVQTSAGHYNVTASHTYTTTGSKTASVFIQDGGGSLQIVDATVNIAGPGLDATFTPFTATEGTAFTGKLSHFSTTQGGAVAGNFTALIDWADGSTTTGTVIASANGGFDVSGGHTWRLGGYKPVSVRVTNTGSGGYTIVGGNNYVGIKPITARGVSLKGTAFVPLAASVANFASANGLAIAGDFTATILWGDGTTSAGTVVAKSGGGFSVLATHTYAAKGTFTAKVTINGISGAKAVATTRITVAKGVASKGPKVGGGHGTPPPTTHGGNPSVKDVKFGAWEKPQQLIHGI